MDASSYKKENIADHGKCINKAVIIKWAVRGASHLRILLYAFFLINKRGSKAAFLAMREDHP